MRPVRALLCSVGAALVLGPAACAALVGADFDSEHLRPSPVANDASVPALDSALPADTGIDPGDTAIPVTPADGGTCPTGLVNCSDVCVNPANDPAHCGKCATACPSDPHGPGVCVSSTCGYACESGWQRCATGCCTVSVPDASGADAAPGLDSGPPDPGVECGAGYCAIGVSSFCCGGGINGSGPDTCDTSSSDPCQWELFCDDAAECGQGSVCCYDDSPGVTTSGCQPTKCPGGQYQFCATDAECTGGGQCTGTFSAPGLQTSYSYCQ